MACYGRLEKKNRPLTVCDAYPDLQSHTQWLLAQILFPTCKVLVDKEVPCRKTVRAEIAGGAWEEGVRVELVDLPDLGELWVKSQKEAAFQSSNCGLPQMQKAWRLAEGGSKV